MLKGIVVYKKPNHYNEGSIPRINTKGLICYDHETKKDAFYFYKANWNKTEKFVYLTSKRYNERKKRTDEIKAYSNCDKVELFVNNKSIGYGKKTAVRCIRMGKCYIR